MPTLAVNQRKNNKRFFNSYLQWMLHLKPRRVFNYMHFSKQIGSMCSARTCRVNVLCCIRCVKYFRDYFLSFITFTSISPVCSDKIWKPIVKLIKGNLIPFYKLLILVLSPLKSECVFTYNKMIGSETESGTCSIRSALVEYAGPVLQPAARSLITEQVMPLSLPLSYRRWHRASTPLSQPLA